ncbi:Hint domain-containing protein [Alphaproteobacteria bacterium KMM 3653]|uniref:Hint domain-containing protein n=1 Tax=Harenicola maris TaxID=2841044 RepID=A0AAP2G7P7_9RHOB|nr:Hint domain-containing protein [Harenicola maris]
MVTASELNINTNAGATAMANAIFGPGVTVVSASYTGDNDSSGIFTGGDATSPGVTPSDTGVILSTGDAEDFTNSNGQSNQSTNTGSQTSGPNGQAWFNAEAGTSTFDASFIDVTFVPDTDVLTMQFVFSSEEYPEYINSIYNDFVGVWIDGNFVEMEVGNGNTSVGNINSGNNINFYNDNTSDAWNTEMDGFTITMTLTIPVTAGEENDIRIGIADVGDANYDSNLLIAGDSVQTEVVAISDSVDMFANGNKTLDVLDNDINNGSGTLTVTHINGVAVNYGDSVTLATGEVVTLNNDGTFDIQGDADLGTVNFTYGIVNGDGTDDVGYVTVNTVPCFVAGTGILTPSGEVPVESLRPGDLVMTLDDGPQPLRWAGRRSVAAQGDYAPIAFAAGALGDHDALELSPQHRVLLSDERAELMFDALEVLVAAKELVNDMTVRRRRGGQVTYVHLMFDRHQIIWSAGLPSESFLPGAQTLSVFDRAVVEEITALFPQLDPRTGQGYSPAARPVLRSFEAQALIGQAPH